jgi:hypothetical protein
MKYACQCNPARGSSASRGRPSRPCCSNAACRSSPKSLFCVCFSASMRSPSSCTWRSFMPSDEKCRRGGAPAAAAPRRRCRAAPAREAAWRGAPVTEAAESARRTSHAVAQSTCAFSIVGGDLGWGARGWLSFPDAVSGPGIVLRRGCLWLRRFRETSSGRPQYIARQVSRDKSTLKELPSEGVGQGANVTYRSL